jgi:hypothetical protein
VESALWMAYLDRLSQNSRSCCQDEGNQDQDGRTASESGSDRGGSPQKHFVCRWLVPGNRCSIGLNAGFAPDPALNATC